MGRHKKIDENTPIQQILQQLKDKTIRPKAVPIKKRAMVMGYLSLDGWSHPQIAQLFECDEKTVQRRLKDFESTNQVTTDVDFIKRKVGYFLVAAENQISALLRIARSVATSNVEKIAAEHSAWKIRMDVMTKLQSIGYLPMQPQKVNADFYHHMIDEREQSPEEMRKLLESIEREGREAGVLDEVLLGRIETIKVKIRQFEMTKEIIELKQEAERKENTDEE